MTALLWTAPTQQLFDGVSVAQNTFTAAKDIPVGDAVTYFHQVGGGQLQQGSTITINGWGVASNTGTPTIILGLYWGGVAAALPIVVSTAKTTTTAMANWPFSFEYRGRVIETGTTGKIMGWGKWYLPTSATVQTTILWPETAPASVTIDTTITKLLTCGATWSASSASNSITLHHMEVLISG